jgi:hypothetical protein
MYSIVPSGSAPNPAVPMPSPLSRSSVTAGSPTVVLGATVVGSAPSWWWSTWSWWSWCGGRGGPCTVVVGQQRELGGRRTVSRLTARSDGEPRPEQTRWRRIMARSVPESDRQSCGPSATPSATQPMSMCARFAHRVHGLSETWYGLTSLIAQVPGEDPDPRRGRGGWASCSMNHSRAERLGEHLVGHLEEERRRPDLAAVRRASRTLPVEVRGDVDPRVSSASGVPIGLPSSSARSGRSRRRSRSVRPDRRGRASWRASTPRTHRVAVHGRLDDAQSGQPSRTSSSARQPTRCTWMWSGCP